MPIRSARTLLICLLASGLVGCRLLMSIVMLPVGLVVAVVGGIAGILVSSEHPGADTDLVARGYRIERRALDVTIAEDSTFEGRLVLERTATAPDGIDIVEVASLSFDPSVQELELLDAWVTTPDGEVHRVGQEHVFDRPAASERGAPEFIAGLTRTVLFPRVVVGATTHVEWRFTQTAPSTLGFDYVWKPPFAIDVVESRIAITHHTDVPLRWAADDGFEVAESSDGDLRTITATLTGYERQRAERAMVAARDVVPRFQATTSESWESVGAAFHAAFADRVEVTPEIAAVAEEVVGDARGLEAARLVHEWMCANVHYVVVYLHPMDGWVPHRASEVLENRYGDCKDLVVLFASLLRARGIAVEPVLVNNDRSFVPYELPTPLQFDHCLAYLPDFDTWSNPTDRYLELGELPVHLSDKQVVVAGEAGRLARTPAGRSEENRYTVRQRAELGTDGIFRGTTSMELTGRAAGLFREQLSASPDLEVVADHLLAADPRGGVGELTSTDVADLSRPLVCSGEWRTDVPVLIGTTLHYMVPSGIDFVNAQLVREMLTTRERRYPALVMASHTHWRTEIVLPEGFVHGDVPERVELETAAGRYTSVAEVGPDGVLVIDRELVIASDRFAPGDYAGLRTLLLAVVVDEERILVAERTGSAG
ncbi:Transglutaminase-like superfamily protein [Planctomycetes bacterium Pla163]|uniref:Transglutaminase-like superfamily protein n=1 Tax=Rohdeia mirabilis TaxID=2528008 RepID=A0A518CV64_9BACT|nr:Transglutaminase-like superfamily protein [Planctomycetes bacterium Pla163]